MPVCRWARGIRAGEVFPSARKFTSDGGETLNAGRADRRHGRCSFAGVTNKAERILDLLWAIFLSLLIAGGMLLIERLCRFEGPPPRSFPIWIR